MPTCLLVRHGQTAANASGTLAGWTPGIPLDDVGRAQVRALAERVAPLPVLAVVTSPLQRCVETAALLADALAGRSATPPEATTPDAPAPHAPASHAPAPHAPEPVTEDGLGECRYGAWTGRSLAELAKDPLWRVVQDHPSSARFPDGEAYPAESLADMAARAVHAVREWDARVARDHGPHAVWVAVSHGDVIKAILADAAGTHLDHFQRIVVNPASVSVVSYTPRRPFVIRTNDAGSDLAALVPKPPPGGNGAAEGVDPSAEGDAAVGGGATGGTGSGSG